MACMSSTRSNSFMPIGVVFRRSRRFSSSTRAGQSVGVSGHGASSGCAMAIGYAPSERTVMNKQLIAMACLAGAALAQAEPIGEVDTVFQWIGPDHKIVVEAYDDPKVAGMTCYVSRAKTGGIKGGLGLAEDKAEASIACRAGGADPHRQAAAEAGGHVHRAHLAGVQEAARGAHGRPEAQCAGLPDLLGPGDRGLAAEQRERGAGGCGAEDTACAKLARRAARVRPGSG